MKAAAPTPCSTVSDSSRLAEVELRGIWPRNGEYGMYSAVVRSRIRATFDAINDGNYQPMLDSFAPAFEYVFHGDHALGGRRTTLRAVQEWWERVFRLLPEHHFHIEQVLVSGTPRTTHVAVKARVTGQPPNAEPYENTMLQLLYLRWGRITRIETLENLQTLETALAEMYAAGHAEAKAPPIID